MCIIIFSFFCGKKHDLNLLMMVVGGWEGGVKHKTKDIHIGII